MASTITLTGDWLVSIGNRRQTSGTGNLGTYATNGIAVAASQVGLGVIQSLVIQPAGGYTFEYVASTGKVKAYYVAGSTPSGTISVPTFTGAALAVHNHNLLVIGGQAGSTTNDVATYGTLDTLGKQEAANATMVGSASATKGGVVGISAGTPAGTISAPTFTGATGTAGAQTEVADTTALAGVTFTFVAQGY